MLEPDLEGSVGSYSQFPTLRQVEPSESWDLQPENLIGVTLGVHQQLSTATDLRATAFTSRLNQLVVGRQDVFSFFTTPPVQGPLDGGVWANDGVGSVFGLELQLRTRSPKTRGISGAIATATRRASIRPETRLAASRARSVSETASGGLT